MGGCDRGRPDGRQVDAQLLARLGAFDQHAALLAGKPAMRAQLLHPFEQAVGAFDAFERDGAAADRDRRLADVERADGAGGGSGRLDVAPVGFRGAVVGHRPFGRQQVGRDLMRADDLDAVRLRPPRQARAARRRRPWPAPASARGRSSSSARLGFSAPSFGRRADAAGKDGMRDAVPLQERRPAPAKFSSVKLFMLEGLRAPDSASPVTITTKGG